MNKSRNGLSCVELVSSSHIHGPDPLNSNLVSLLKMLTALYLDLTRLSKGSSNDVCE